MIKKKLRILLAEGDPAETTAGLRELYPESQDGLELTIVSTIPTLTATLEIVNPEVIFVDLSLAHPDPLGAVRRVHRSAPDVPLIVLADSSDKNCAAQSLSQGALDYLLKGFIDTRTLERVLREALAHNTLEGLADLLRDSVTGLYIRDGFLTLGKRAMETAKRRKSTLVLLCMRIDNLAALRAGHGPTAAESSLREVAALLAGGFRGTDIIARLGESQFAALAVDAAEPSAPVLCQRMEKRIAVLNRDRGPRDPLELRISARFWSSKETITFSEFLDSVEAGLRLPAIPFAQETASRRKIEAAEKR
ncbi:MAG TPA: diguanylate cyclase [Candidatus Eisenbacteria bacterium]|nr:diguanylate cyclase [Candidatus Eisenbacteria bacterium]